MAKRKASGIQRLIFVIFLIVALIVGGVTELHSHVWGVLLFIVIFVVGWLAAASIRVANQWEKAVVLRLGKFKALAGPGMFGMVPFVDSISSYIDQRIITTQLRAEQTLTKDSIPLNVDAVLFWMVWDAQKAALEVADYENSVLWAAQTALRDIIGRTNLDALLSTRETLDVELKHLMDDRTEPWGITIQDVQIRDIRIPGNLQDAMSRAAQADRERTARTILGEAEKQVAESFLAAAEMYNNNPVALQLRAMNILYNNSGVSNTVELFPEYRGYAQSGGSVSDVYSNTVDTENAMAAAESLPFVNNKFLSLAGVSMGGAVALQVASSSKYATSLDYLVIESPFVGWDSTLSWAEKHPGNKLAQAWIDEADSYDSSLNLSSPGYRQNSIDILKIDPGLPILILQEGNNRKKCG